MNNSDIMKMYNSNLLIRFRRAFPEDVIGKAYYQTSDDIWILPVSDTACKILKPDGTDKIFEETVIDNINDTDSTIDFSELIIYVPYFNTEYMERIADDRKLFTMSYGYIVSQPDFCSSKIRPVYHYMKTTEDEILFTTLDGKEYHFTMKELIGQIRRLFNLYSAQQDAIYRFGLGVSEYTKDAAAYSNVINSILLPFVPVSEINFDDVIQNRNDLISVDTPELKQIYRYNNKLYRIKRVDVNGVDIVNVLGFSDDIITVSHSEALSFEPIPEASDEKPKKLRYKKCKTILPHDDIIYQTKAGMQYYASEIFGFATKSGVSADEIQTAYKFCAVCKEAVFECDNDNKKISDYGDYEQCRIYERFLSFFLNKEGE